MTMQVPLVRFLRNPGREVRSIECEFVRRIGLLGIRADDSAAIRRLFERAGTEKSSRMQESITSDLLGLGLLLVCLLRQSSTAGGLALEPATQAFVDAMLCAPASVPKLAAHFLTQRTA